MHIYQSIRLSIYLLVGKYEAVVKLHTNIFVDFSIYLKGLSYLYAYLPIYLTIYIAIYLSIGWKVCGCGETSFRYN